MGFFGNIKDRFKKSEAAVVVENLLTEQVRLGHFGLDPAFIANILVDKAWSQKPDIYCGKFGQRPHKISTAAMALACGLQIASEDNRPALFLALKRILEEVERNGSLYPLNSLDGALLESALTILAETGQAMRAAQGSAQELGADGTVSAI